MDTGEEGRVCLSSPQLGPVGAGTSAQARFCPRCGHRVSQDARFCGNCGLWLRTPEEAKRLPIAAVEPAPAPVAMPVAEGASVAPSSLEDEEEEYGGPVRVRWAGRLLSAELASFTVVLAIVLSTVLILSVYRYFRDHPLHFGSSSGQTVEAPPQTNTVPRPAAPTHRKKRVLPRTLPPDESQSETGSSARPPFIASFGASAASIEPGGTAELSWSVDGATSVTIEPGIGTFSDAQASVPVHPLETTTYRLIATGPGGTTRSSVTLNVVGAKGRQSSPATR